jgi:hypothetical protein
MTQKSICNVYLEEQCIWCGGEGVVEEGKYDDVRLVECECRKEAKAANEAEPEQ